jgi:hypothetical protein
MLVLLLLLDPKFHTGVTVYSFKKIPTDQTVPIRFPIVVPMDRPLPRHLSGGGGTLAPVSLEFLRQLRNVQYSLKCELAMNDVEKVCRAASYADLFSFTHVHVFAAQKRHYLFLLLLLSTHDPRGSQNVDSFLASLLEDSRPALNGDVPWSNSKAVLSMAQQARDPFLIDTLTFSLLPSLFNFFLTEFGIQEFIEFMGHIPDRLLFMSYARMVFLSPLFLQFLNVVFMPLLSHVQDHLGNRIRQRWAAHLDLVPYVVIAFLNSCPSPVETLSAACFEIALTPETAAIFGLLYFNQSLSVRLTGVLRDLLTLGGRQSILSELVTSLVNAGTGADGVVSCVHLNDVPTLFEVTVLSQLDFTVYGDGQRKLPPSYGPGLYRLTEQREGDAIVFQREGTMIGRRGEAWLRHLLQDADPVPRFKKVPPDLTFGRFIGEYLEERGPSETYARRIDAVRSLQQFSGIFNEHTCTTLLQKTTMTRTLEIRVLSIFAEIHDILGAAHLASRRLRAHVEKVVRYRFLSDFWRQCEPIRLSVPFPKICAAPARVRELFDAIKTKLSTVNSHLATAFETELIYGFLSQSFCFSEFLKCRPDLHRLDVHASEMLSSPDWVFDRALPERSRSEKIRRLRHRLDRLRCDRQDLLDLIRFAAQEEAVLVKMHGFSDAFAAVKTFILSGFPPSVEIGADEIMPATSCYVAAANPESLVSNFAFLGDLCASTAVPSITDDCDHVLAVLRATIEDVHPDLEMGKIFAGVLPMMWEP